MCAITLNGKATTALIDSGNLIANVISEKFATRIFGNDLKPYVQAIEGFQYIGTAEKGAKLSVLGKVIHPLDLKIEGSRVKFKTQPLVLKGLSMDVNISGPFLATHGIDQLHSRGALKIRSQLIKLLNYEEHANRKEPLMAPLKQHSSQQEGHKSSPVTTEGRMIHDVVRHAYTAEEKDIPARSVGYIKIQIPDIEKGKIPAGEGLLTARPEFIEKTNGHPALAAIVLTDRQGQTYTSILNSNDENMRIKRGCVFGEYQPKQLLGLHQMTSPDQSSLSKPTTLAEKKEWIKKEFNLEQTPW
jgi:hypothetical protein